MGWGKGPRSRPPSAVLTAAVQVAIATGGFAGIVIVLGPSRGAQWSYLSRMLLSALLLSTIAIVAFGFLPLILAATSMRDTTVWLLSSSFAHFTWSTLSG